MVQKNVKDTEKKGVLWLLKWIARWILPAPVRDWLGTRLYGQEYSPPPEWVSLGSLRRVTPISRVWGCDRGQPIDRYYIERYFIDCAPDIHGHVLEIGDSRYTHYYGGDRVTKSDVLHVKEGNPEATIVADLSHAPEIPSDTFDCIILTQTLHLIYDVRATIETLYRILKPGGVALVTFPGISQISHQAEKGWADSWYWSFTANSAHRLFEEVFPAENVRVVTYGNVLSAIAFLHGLGAEELCQKELDHCDPDYQFLITVRIVKPESEQ
jgi:SAM-dependent methyltransferase